MGLDILHCKACLDKQTGKSPLIVYAETADDFDHFNVGFDHFQKYIQMVDIPELIDSVIVVRQQDYLEETLSRFKNDKRTVLHLDEDSEASFLLDYRKKKSLQHCQVFHQNNVQGHKWKVIHFYVNKKMEGFYFRVVGEQRKGMKSSFWQYFYSMETYNFALKKDFDHAFSCLDDDTLCDAETLIEKRKEYFATHFLHTYEEGRSYLSLSY
jgi:hypothetical protein